MANSPPAASSTDSFTQGLLSALQPWLTGGAPSNAAGSLNSFGGPSGLLSVMLADGPGGVGAENAARTLQAVQDEALKRAAVRQQLAQQSLGLQLKGAMLPMQLAMMRAYYGGALGGGASAPATSGAQPSAPSGLSGSGSMSAGNPPGSPGASTQPSAMPPPSTPSLTQFSVPTPQQIGGIRVGGLPPGYGRLWAFMNNKNPVQVETQQHAQQVKLAQEQYGPVLAELDTLDKAQSPTQYVTASPVLRAEWNKIAPTLGYDPVKGFNDANVRTAFTFLRNRIAGALSEPTIAPPVQVGTIPGPLGSLFQRDPVTAALRQIKPEEALKQVATARGPVFATASQAAGAPAFNEETWINPSTTQGMAQMIANYEAPPLTNYALERPQGQAIMAAVYQINPKYDATQYTTKNAARIRFAVGKQGDTVRSLSVATSHLNMLSDAAHALAQHDFPTFNQLSNAIGVHLTGANPQTNFDAMRDIVGDEVVKAIVGTGGSEADREAIKDSFDAARSPAQIEGVINKYEALLGGQLRGLRRQYEKSTGLHDFNTFVSTLARAQLNSAANKALGSRGAPSPGAPLRISGDAQYNNLAPGTVFIAPDGSLRRKP